MFSNPTTQLPNVHRRHERQKRNIYKSRVREVEHASFTPLVWSTSGGAGPTASVFLKRLASRLSEKRDEPYSVVMAWLHCRFTFSLLRSAIMCIRGTRSSIGRPVNLSASLALAEGRFTT